MSTILIYDWDFFHYPQVIPNLECAKYAAWRKQKKDIVVFNDNLNPSMYSKTFFRKEYDDGIYDDIILNPTVDYGGRAFSQIYKQFDPEMEHIYPDFEIYRKYKELYGTKKRQREEIRTILYATHVRLSLDGKTLEDFPYDRLQPRHPSVILHDYDLASIPNAFELLEDVSRQRPSGLPYRIGNKYPINVYTFDELMKWLKLPPMGTCFYLQYNGLFTTDELATLCEKPILGLRQMIYNFAFGCSDEDDFIDHRLSEFYKQLLFLRSHDTKILLNIDNELFKTRELIILIKLFGCYYGRSYCEFVRPHRETLYEWCAWKRRAYIETLPWNHISITQQEMRESFQYIRKRNYDVFDMFYSTPNVIIQGGKLINEWHRNQKEN